MAGSASLLMVVVCGAVWVWEVSGYRPKRVHCLRRIMPCQPILCDSKCS